MAKAPYQSYAADTAGNVLEWPFTVTVRREATGGIARIYDADDNPLANPLSVSEINGWAEGFFRFHAAGGSYRIDVTKGAYSAEPLRHVQIGTYAGADQGVINDPGYKYEFEVETTAPPTEGYFRANNADLSLATELYFHKTTRGGFDQAARLLALNPGTHSHHDVIFVTGTDLGGASWEVDNADDSSGADDFVTLTVSGHAGVTAFVTDVYSITVSIAGHDGQDSAQSVNGQTAAAANKATLVDADKTPIVDSEAADGLKYQTWAQRWTQILAKLGALIGTTKATPIDADGFFIADSAASNAPKVTLFSALKATLKAYFDTLYPAKARFTDWVAYTPTFTGFGTVSGVSVFSRRIGDSLEIRGVLTAGTATAVEARMTLGFGGTNGGITIDATKNPALMLSGTAAVNTNNNGDFSVLAETSAGYVTFGSNITGGAMVKATGSALYTTGAVVGIRACVPITGW